MTLQHRHGVAHSVVERMSRRGLTSRRGRHLVPCASVRSKQDLESGPPRPLPKLVLGDVGSIFDLNADAIAFEGYDPWPAIKAPVAV